MPIDPSAVVAPTARVHAGATIGPRTVIGEYCVIESDVLIGASCRLEPYVHVKRWTTLGDRNEISSGTLLGTDPLDKAFTGERSYLRIGNDNRIREHYTISRGTRPESVTEIGDGNYIMTSGHIAHNCKVGDNTVICSCALLAGYVEVEDLAFISGKVDMIAASSTDGLASVLDVAMLQDDRPLFVILIDNLRYDQWKVLQPVLEPVAQAIPAGLLLTEPLPVLPAGRLTDRFGFPALTTVRMPSK